MAFPLHESDSWCVLNTLPAYAHVILRAASKGTFGHDPHLIDKEIKAQRGCVTCWRAHSWREDGAGAAVGVRPWAAVLWTGSCRHEEERFAPVTKGFHTQCLSRCVSHRCWPLLYKKSTECLDGYNCHLFLPHMVPGGECCVPGLLRLATSGTGAWGLPLDTGSDTQGCGNHRNETLGGPGIRPLSLGAEHSPTPHPARFPLGPALVDLCHLPFPKVSGGLAPFFLAGSSSGAGTRTALHWVDAA